MYDIAVNQKGKDNFYKIWHTPQKNTFLFIEAGKGSIVFRDKSYPMQSGVLCYIGKNKYHYTFPTKPMEYTRSKLFLESNIMDSLTHVLGNYPNFTELFNEDAIIFSILGENDKNAVRDIFDTLNSLSEDSKYIQAEISSAAIRLMIILTKNAITEARPEPNSLQTVINFINQHISEDISIDKISEICYINKYYLCRLFKGKIGITVMGYIVQTRITMAKELLKKEDISVTQVSILCGFSSPSYFSRIFKEKTGLSPSAYRNQKNTGIDVSQICRIKT